MKRVIALLACSAALAGCSSADLNKWSGPSMDFSSFRGSAGSIGVRVESEPAGAEAKGPSGVGCRTPCVLQLPANGMTSVVLALPGYQTQSVPVTVSTIREAVGDLPDTGTPAEAVRIDPNPVYAILQPAPPPLAPKKPPPKAKPKPKPQAQAPQAQQAAPPPPPPPGQPSGPWR